MDVIILFVFENLTRNEYFPAELPPCFNTKIVADNCTKINKWVSGVKRKQSIALTYSGYKNENSRRKFAIPNIYHYFKAVSCLVENSAEIFKVLDQSTISLSKPLHGVPLFDKPYNKITYSITETKPIVEKLYQNNLYQIKLDINSFFDSIYTHTIPWAMHTKILAKKSDGKSSVGDKLDICTREMNYGQTNGILVGNAFSRIISEIILCTIDKGIQAKFKQIKCCRFVDDYHIFLKDSAQIQNVVSFIRYELGKYELMLNENKIQINESPFVYEKPWVEEVKLFVHLNSDIFLNKVISLYTKYKDISIIRFGVAVLSKHDLSNKNWNVIESKLINLWVRFPSISDLVIKIFLKKRRILNKTNLKYAIYSILNRCIPLNLHQEAIWAVWIAKVFNVIIKKEYIIKIIDSENQLAIIILLDMIHSGKCNLSQEVMSAIINMRENLKKYDIDENEEDVNKKQGHLLWTQNWLLAYEAELHKWFDIDGEKFKYAINDSFYKSLIKNKIGFYDVNFTYNKVSTVNKSIQYITKNDFLLYIEKMNKLLTQVSELKENSTYILKIENIRKEIMDKVSAQSVSY